MDPFSLLLGVIDKERAMSRYVRLCEGSDIADLRDEVIVLSPKSGNYVGFRGAARDVLLSVQRHTEPVSAAMLARFAISDGSGADPAQALRDAEHAIEACFQRFIDEGVLMETRR